MRQNSDLLRTELRYSESQRTNDIARALAGENPSVVFAKHLTNLEDLSFEEQVEIDAFYYLYFENWRSMYDLYSIGLIDDEWRNRIDQDALWLLNNPYGRARWESEQVIMPEEVVDYTNYVLENNPLNATSGAKLYYDTLFNNALNYKEELQN